MSQDEWLLILGVVGIGAAYVYIRALIDYFRNVGWRSALLVVGVIGGFVALLWGISLVQRTETAMATIPIASWMGKLVDGTAVVTVPVEAKQYEGFSVTLFVTPRALQHGSTDEQTVAVGIAPRMRAELLGADFDVDEKGPREQAMSRTQTTAWRWKVKSDWPGDRMLRVRVDAMTTVAGHETPRMFDVVEHTVKVKINPVEFVVRNWQWVFSALALPLVGFVFRKRQGASK